MTSHYLNRPLRPRHVVIAEMLANASDTYLILDLARGEPYFREADLGQSFARVVQDLAEGQYDFRDPKTGHMKSPVAIVRISRDAPMEDVTEKVAEAILQYLIEHDDVYDEEGYLKRCPFLDNAMPDWADRLPRGRGKADPPEYEYEDRLERKDDAA